MTALAPLLAEVHHHLPVNGESRRLFFGRGKCFRGFDDVVIDYHPGLILICLYRQRERSWVKTLAEALRSILPQARCVMVQLRYEKEAPTTVVSGELVQQPFALEDGLRYHLRLTRGINSGFFLDMAFGRRLVRELSRNKKVLNLFAYTCSFSVAALSGGASQVVNVDMNRRALELGRANHRLNGLELRNASFMALEIFRSHSRIRKQAPFDLIICDPPARQGRSFSAKKHWPKLLNRLTSWLAPGGELVLCLNGPHYPQSFLEDLIASSLPGASLLQCLTSGSDFPDQNPHCRTRLYHLCLS